MRLIRFGEKESEKPGIFLNGERRDCSYHFNDWNQRFFNEGGLRDLQKLITKEGGELPVIKDDTRWASCIPRPGMIMCVGLNYTDHAREAGMELPKEPILFMKAANTLQGPYDDVPVPRKSKKTDWEAELAMVIGRDSLYLKDESEAEDAIAGYCVMNDLSEREFQLEMGGQWVKGKSCPGFSPIGPFLVTPEEVPDPLGLAIQLSVNGEIKQNGHTQNMVFKPTYLVYYISQFMKLEAGDVITTGTPSGVGMGMKPQRFLAPGDVVELSIEGLGSQKQIFTE